MGAQANIPRAREVPHLPGRADAQASRFERSRSCEHTCNSQHGLGGTSSRKEPRGAQKFTGASGSYDSETYQAPEGVKIKDEPDDHLSLSGSDYGSEGMKSPPMNTTGMSPIDMETQEKIKLDRKRQRNRLAASKCRKRKLERISQLDDRVSALKNENADLAAVVKKMKAGVALLKQEVIEHVNSGCDIRVAEGANF